LGERDRHERSEQHLRPAPAPFALDSDGNAFVALDTGASQITDALGTLTLSHSPSGVNNHGLVVAKLGATDGRAAWGTVTAQTSNVAAGLSGGELTAGIATTPSGDVVGAGSFYKTLGAGATTFSCDSFGNFFIKLNGADGTTASLRQLGACSSGTPIIEGIFADSAGVVLPFDHGATTPSMTSPFVFGAIELDPTGVPIGALGATGTSVSNDDPATSSSARDPSRGTLVYAGHFAGNFDFGDGKPIDVSLYRQRVRRALLAVTPAGFAARHCDTRDARRRTAEGGLHGAPMIAAPGRTPARRA
jgi:hypothetical protein